MFFFFFFFARFLILWVVYIFLNLVLNYKNIIMEKEMNLSYEAPAVEVIEVEVEKGFAQSDLPEFENVPL